MQQQRTSQRWDSASSRLVHVQALVKEKGKAPERHGHDSHSAMRMKCAKNNTGCRKAKQQTKKEQNKTNPTAKTSSQKCKPVNESGLLTWKQHKPGKTTTGKRAQTATVRLPSFKSGAQEKSLSAPTTTPRWKWLVDARVRVGRVVRLNICRGLSLKLALLYFSTPVTAAHARALPHSTAEGATNAPHSKPIASAPYCHGKNLPQNPPTLLPKMNPFILATCRW